MSNTPRPLTRAQLRQFAPDPRALRSLEQAIQQGSLLPSDIATLTRLIEESYVEASLGTARANQALGLLSSISQSLELLAKAPVVQPVPLQNDVSPTTRQPLMSELADASIKTPAANNVLSYDATLRVWKNVSSVAEIHAAASKSPPVDADEIPLADSAASFGLKKLTWANLKAAAKTYFDTLYLGVLATAADSSKLLGATWASPAAIGSTVAAAGSFAALSATVSSAGATIEVLKVSNPGAGALTKAKLGFYAAGSNYASINGGYGAAAPELSFDIAGILAMTLKGTGLVVVGDVSATTSLTGPGGAVLMKTSAALTNGAGAAAGTLLTAPVAGNPTKWIGINDNGTTRYIPAW
jgi:hypothetical protein